MKNSVSLKLTRGDYELAKALRQCNNLGPSYMVSGTRDSPPPKATLSSVYM